MVARELPMSMVRNLAHDANREVRRRAYEAELAGWERAAVPLAAALNSIKGEVNTLSRKRGWATPLDAALFDAAIDRPTLDAMMQAAREAFPDFRRYLRAKARALGLERLAWYDLFAPVGGAESGWSFDEATSVRRRAVRRLFTAHERLRRARLRRALDRRRAASRQARWRLLHAAARRRVARVGQLHALVCGHEYAGARVRARLPQPKPGWPHARLQRETPMTLAETASIFCETIVQRAALQRADAAGQLDILEAALRERLPGRGGYHQPLSLRAGRLRAAPPARTFDRGAERADARRAARRPMATGWMRRLLHPYMWAVKGHYYSAGRSFYNFPYMFGLLFGLGLYARYEQDPEAFRRELRRPALLDRAGRRRDARRALRLRPPHARLLARQPRYRAARHRPLRGAGSVSIQ